jgi:alanine dehydrogenase
MVLLISEKDIQAVELSPEEVIAAVEKAYSQDGRGLAYETPRMELKIKGRNLPHIAPGTTSIGQGMAYLEEENVFVITHTYHFNFHKYVSQVIDPETGETIAVVKRGRAPLGEKAEGINSGGLRTGAAAAIGAKYMANKEIETVGVIGTGRVGSASLLCLSKVKNFNQVLVHSGRRMDEKFSKHMSKIIGVDIKAAESLDEVVVASDILITATYATSPIVRGEWLKEGVHINGMGADGPMKAELDLNSIKRADKIVIDSSKCMSIGEIAHAIEKGVIKPDEIHGKIGEVVAGVKPGRENAQEITFFESDGTHMQSAAVVHAIYIKAKEAGLGVETSEIGSFFYNP